MFYLHREDQNESLPDLLALTEKRATNAHDIWTMERTRQGWTFGVNRDDRNKMHPDLVPYHKLSDSEGSTIVRQL